MREISPHSKRKKRKVQLTTTQRRKRRKTHRGWVYGSRKKTRKSQKTSKNSKTKKNSQVTKINYESPSTENGDASSSTIQKTKNLTETKIKTRKSKQIIFTYTANEKRALLRQTLSNYREKVDVWLMKWAVHL